MLESGINFLPDENPLDYAALKADLFVRFKPLGRSEEKLVTAISKAAWKLQRVQRSNLDRGLASDTQK